MQRSEKGLEHVQKGVVLRLIPWLSVSLVYIKRVLQNPIQRIRVESMYFEHACFPLQNEVVSVLCLLLSYVNEWNSTRPRSGTEDNPYSSVISIFLECFHSFLNLKEWARTKKSNKSLNLKFTLVWSGFYSFLNVPEWKGTQKSEKHLKRGCPPFNSLGECNFVRLYVIIKKKDIHSCVWRVMAKLDKKKTKLIPLYVHTLVDLIQFISKYLRDTFFIHKVFTKKRNSTSTRNILFNKHNYTLMIRKVNSYSFVLIPNMLW